MNKHKGFTLVELLIVIVVIAILAAITLVAYNGIQKKAQDTSLRSDLTNAGKVMSLWTVDHTMTELRAAYGGSGAAYVSGGYADNALTTSLMWEDVEGVPPISVSPTTTLEIIAEYKGVNADRAPEANDHMINDNSFCLTGASKGGTYNYRIMSAIRSQYNKLLFYDSKVGHVATLEELGEIYDSGGEITCEAHLLLWRDAIA